MRWGVFSGLHVQCCTVVTAAWMLGLDVTRWPGELPLALLLQHRRRYFKIRKLTAARNTAFRAAELDEKPRRVARAISYPLGRLSTTNSADNGRRIAPRTIAIKARGDAPKQSAEDRREHAIGRLPTMSSRDGVAAAIARPEFNGYVSYTASRMTDTLLMNCVV